VLYLQASLFAFIWRAFRGDDSERFLCDVKGRLMKRYAKMSSVSAKRQALCNVKRKSKNFICALKGRLMNCWNFSRNIPTNIQC